MNTKPFNYYSYRELRERLDAPDCEQTDIDTLGAWFDEFYMSEWDGEYYDADGLRLFPVYQYDEARDQYDLVHFEAR